MKTTVKRVCENFSKRKLREIQDLWLGEDFLFDGRRYCLLEIDGEKKEVKAIRLAFDYPASIGNPIVTFPFGSLVKFIQRGEIK